METHLDWFIQYGILDAYDVRTKEVTTLSPDDILPPSLMSTDTTSTEVPPPPKKKYHTCSFCELPVASRYELPEPSITQEYSLVLQQYDTIFVPQHGPVCGAASVAGSILSLLDFHQQDLSLAREHITVKFIQDVYHALGVPNIYETSAAVGNLTIKKCCMAVRLPAPWSSFQVTVSDFGSHLERDPLLKSQSEWEKIKRGFKTGARYLYHSRNHYNRIFGWRELWNTERKDTADDSRSSSNNNNNNEGTCVSSSSSSCARIITNTVAHSSSSYGIPNDDDAEPWMSWKPTSIRRDYTTTEIDEREVAAVAAEDQHAQTGSSNNALGDRTFARNMPPTRTFGRITRDDAATSAGTAAVENVPVLLAEPAALKAAAATTTAAVKARPMSLLEKKRAQAAAAARAGGGGGITTTSVVLAPTIPCSTVTAVTSSSSSSSSSMAEPDYSHCVVRRQVLCAKKGQRPQHWVDWSDICADIATHNRHHMIFELKLVDRSR